MKLTADQTEGLPFPVGCPVWYGFNDYPNQSSTIINETEEQPMLKRGVVRSVSFDYISKAMIYEVGYHDSDSAEDSVIEEVSEDHLAYGANCSVSIDIGDKLVEGTILLCKPASDDPGKFLYTVMTSTEGRFMYTEDIDAERVVYRKVKTDTTITETTDSLAASIRKDATPADYEPKDKLPASGSTANPKEGTVPASISCRNNEEGGAGRRNEKMREDTAFSTNDAHSKSTISVGSSKSKNYNETQMQMNLPLWLQRDLPSQKKLFFGLIGSKRENRTGIQDIGRKTNCRIVINFDPDTRGTKPTAPITISIDTLSRGSSALRDLHDAREKIQELLLCFLDHIDDHGAKGRLIYEVASSCWGAHRPKDSTSRAVVCANEVISIVDLPFVVENGKRKVHAAFLLTSGVLASVRRYDCFIKVCGDGFRIEVKSCAPYVLVQGKSWQSVDRAVEIVRGKIRHMDNW
mmetsp:Transcript_26006/g.47821  ORF Transcript_26006/g.47821 Transcript_26006/m.47821 type:complete len:463 (-) Transcript_26006:115-1503(-)